MSHPFLSDRHGCVGPIGYLEPGGGRLPFRLTPHVDEPLFCYVSRLALEAGYRSTTGFMHAYLPDIPYRDVVEGKAHEEVARRVGFDKSVFARATPIMQEDGSVALGTAALNDPRAISFEYLSVCRLCLDEQRTFVCDEPDAFVEPHLITLWFHRHVRACPTHRVMLEPLRYLSSDPATWASGGLAATSTAAPVAASEDEILVATFVFGRFGFGPPIAEAPEVAALPFDDAVAAYAEVARKLTPDDLKRFDLHHALRSGLALAAGANCPKTIEIVLDRIGKQSFGGSRLEVYGSLFSKLAVKAAGTATTRPFAEAVLRSAAKFASDGARPVEWMPRWPARAPAAVQLCFDTALIDQEATATVGLRALARALRCHPWLARLTADYMSVQREAGCLPNYRNGFACPIVSSEAVLWFLNHFVSFLDLAERWTGDEAELYQTLHEAEIVRIDDSMAKPAMRRLGRYHAFFEREAAEQVLGPRLRPLPIVGVSDVHA